MTRVCQIPGQVAALSSPPAAFFIGLFVLMLLSNAIGNNSLNILTIAHDISIAARVALLSIGTPSGPAICIASGQLVGHFGARVFRMQSVLYGKEVSFEKCSIGLFKSGRLSHLIKSKY